MAISAPVLGPERPCKPPREHRQTSRPSCHEEGTNLAEPYLPSVTAQTLLIVGSHDAPVIETNQAAYNLLTCEKKLIIVPHATHLFAAPDTLKQIAELAGK